MPGREARISEKPFNDLNALLAAVSEQLLSFLDVPFALFGHSMGALVAFELARQLRRAYGITAARLIVSGRRAPRLAPSEPPAHTLAEPDLIAYLRELDGIPEEIFRDAAFMNVMLPVLRADFAVCEKYSYRQDHPLFCGLTVFGGRDDPHVPPADLEDWRMETAAECEVRLFQGGHFFIRTAAAEVLEAVSNAVQPAWSVARGST
jgi:surfactin synthase thioesterase subunit